MEIFSTVKMENLMFLIFLLKPLIEPHHRGGSNEYPQSLFWIKSKKNEHTPVNPSIYQRTIGPENAHLKPDLGVLSHHEMTLT